jgi:hypothetical protein
MTTKTFPGFLSKAIALATATAVLNQHACADPVVSPGFGLETYYSHTTGDSIISFDRDASSNLYYMTSAGFPDVSVWKYSGGPTPSTIYSNPSNFAGASVLTIGDYVYFNDSNSLGTQFIHAYGPVSGAPSVNLLSTTRNSNLHTDGTRLFIAGAPGFGTNHIYYSNLAPNGDLVNDPAIDLGVTSGFSGPLAFDLDGNLYYAPGFSDLSIYKWTASEVNAAIANPVTNPLNVAGHEWLDYTLLYGTAGGATSMLLDVDGDLLVTLSDFENPSVLVEFGVTPAGAHDGTNTTILSETGRLGELRNFDGNIMVSAGNDIYKVVPEPSSLLLALAGAGLVLSRRRRD